MDPEVVRRLRAKHEKARHSEECWACDVPWPCPTVALLADWERRGVVGQRLYEAAESYASAAPDKYAVGRLTQALLNWRAAQSPEPTEPEVSPAPCRVCGYSGPGYYQPETHPCAARAALSPEPVHHFMRGPNNLCMHGYLGPDVDPGCGLPESAHRLSPEPEPVCETCAGTGEVAYGLPSNGPVPCPVCGTERCDEGRRSGKWTR